MQSELRCRAALIMSNQQREPSLPAFNNPGSIFILIGFVFIRLL
jgi:hypothetical protein